MVVRVLGPFRGFTARARTYSVVPHGTAAARGRRSLTVLRRGRPSRAAWAYAIRSSQGADGLVCLGRAREGPEPVADGTGGSLGHDRGYGWASGHGTRISSARASRARSPKGGRGQVGLRLNGSWGQAQKKRGRSWLRTAVCWEAELAVGEVAALLPADPASVGSTGAWRRRALALVPGPGFPATSQRGQAARGGGRGRARGAPGQPGRRGHKPGGVGHPAAAPGSWLGGRRLGASPRRHVTRGGRAGGIAGTRPRRWAECVIGRGGRPGRAWIGTRCRPPTIEADAPGEEGHSGPALGLGRPRRRQKKKKPRQATVINRRGVRTFRRRTSPWPEGFPPGGAADRLTDRWARGTTRTELGGPSGRSLGARGRDDYAGQGVGAITGIECRLGEVGWSISRARRVGRLGGQGVRGTKRSG